MAAGSAGGGDDMGTGEVPQRARARARFPSAAGVVVVSCRSSPCFASEPVGAQLPRFRAHSKRYFGQSAFRNEDCASSRSAKQCLHNFGAANCGVGHLHGAWWGAPRAAIAFVWRPHVVALDVRHRGRSQQRVALSMGCLRTCLPLCERGYRQASASCRPHARDVAIPRSERLVSCTEAGYLCKSVFAFAWAFVSMSLT